MDEPMPVETEYPNGEKQILYFWQEPSIGLNFYYCYPSDEHKFYEFVIVEMTEDKSFIVIEQID